MDRVDASLRDLTGYCLRRASTKVLALASERLAPFGLRRTTFSALSVVVDNPGIHQSKLADALAIERPNVVQIVDELEKAGFLRRVPVPTDRRLRGLEPTEDGKRVCAAAYDRLYAMEQALTRDLSAEEAQALRRALKRIEENAERQRADELSVSEA